MRSIRPALPLKDVDRGESELKNPQLSLEVIQEMTSCRTVLYYAFHKHSTVSSYPHCKWKTS